MGEGRTRTRGGELFKSGINGEIHGCSVDERWCLSSFSPVSGCPGRDAVLVGHLGHVFECMSPKSFPFFMNTQRQPFPY